MAQDTLVLNTSSVPVAVLNWEKVMTLWAKDRVEVVETDPDRLLRSKSFEMGMPVVVRLKNDFAKKMRREIPFSRRNVAIRDNHRCQYCGKVLRTEEYTYDHVTPQSRGGKSSWKNLVLACVPCNSYKANRTPEEAGMFLINKPTKPSVNDPRFQFRLKIKRLKPQWERYASWLYWNVELEK